MKTPKRKFEPQSLGEVLDDIIHSKALNAGITNAKVNALWIQLMGENINSYTEKITLKNRTLTVALSSAPLREELSYGKEKIIKMMNEELGEPVIEKIILR